MKCEKCGAEIPEGKMYCQDCGQEIQIVPDFEPEVEQTISQTMDHILKDVFHGDKEQKKKVSHAKKRPFFRWFIALFILSLITLAIAMLYMDYTADFQIRRGNYFRSQGDYRKAIVRYEQAFSLEPENSEILLYIAGCYEMMGNPVGYEASLTKVVQHKSANIDQKNTAYERLAALYLESEEYEKIHGLLKDCTDEEIMKSFGKYCAAAPDFSVQPGNYNEMVALKLQSQSKGTIYYTINGKDPDTESKVYTTPIFLYNGTHEIKAIFVNEYGVTSDITVGKYIIKF